MTETKLEYKDTLNLPQTTLEMRANAAVKEVETQVFVTRLSAVFGAFAAVPLFMAWINIGWFIILIGAELSYAFQNVNNYNIE